MATSLSAHHKNLKEIFNGDDRFVIPEFQRPYAWTDDQLLQLHNDIIGAFQAGEEYFVGTIVMSRSNLKKQQYVLVDGQQRLTTFWLMIKVLSILMPKNAERFNRMLMYESWDEDSSVPRIRWNGDTRQQNEQIAAVAEWEERDFIEQKPIGQLESNAKKLYSWLEFYMGRLSAERCADFRDFVMESLYLLPIEISGSDADQSLSKSLTVFETLNDRGLELRDTDIFKSRIFSLAVAENEYEKVNLLWNDLESGCHEIGMELDELFRAYSHVVRGVERITTNEKRLRDLFLNEPYSPLRNLPYTVILQQLGRMLKAIERVDKWARGNGRCAAWLQILFAYTNRYPWYAVCCYFYRNLDDSSMLTPEKVIELLQRVLRYCYMQGATTTVKFEVYNMVVNIMAGKELPDYARGFNPAEQVDYPWRLRTGLSLLYFYLCHPHTGAVSNAVAGAIVRPAVDGEVIEALLNADIENAPNSLANYMITSGTLRSVPFEHRYQHLLEEGNADMLSQLPSDGRLTTDYFDNRWINICKVLTEFYADRLSHLK